MRINRPAATTTTARLISAFSNSFGVAMPGIVVSYDEETETAVVTPAVGRLVPAEDNEDEDEVEYIPDLPSVPVLWFRARGVSMTGTLQAGDPVLLICCDRDISAWRRSGGVQEPDTARAHHWHASVAIPGLEPDAEAFPAPSDAAALASKLDLLIGAILGALTTTDPDLAALKATLTWLFPNIDPKPPLTAASPDTTLLSTTGSTLLKVSS